jgi:predicted phosphodiesterase
MALQTVKPGTFPLQELILNNYLPQWPEMPSRTLAKKISRETGVYTVEQCRTAIRYLRGKNGSYNRNHLTNRTFQLKKNADLWNKYQIPPSIDEAVAPYLLPKSVNTCLVMADIHVPFHSEQAINIVLEYADKRKIDCIIINGDFTDCYQLSRFCKEPSKALFDEEVATSKEILSILRKNWPKAHILYKFGNHENRFTRYIWQNAPVIWNLSQCTLDGILECSKMGIEVLASEQVIKYKELTVAHGHEIMYGKSVLVNPARSTFLKAKDICMIAHYHATSEHHERTINDVYIANWSMGCLCQLKPKYNPFNNWNHGFAIVNIEDKGTWRVENKRIINGKIM